MNDVIVIMIIFWHELKPDYGFEIPSTPLLPIFKITKGLFAMFYA